MEILLKTDSIKKTISAIQSICQKKTISEITQNFEIEIAKKNIYIKATDLEIYVEINIAIEDIIKQSNNTKAIINAKIFFDVIKDIEEPLITLQILSNKCIITSTHSSIELNIFSEEQFPHNELKIENILNINNKHIITSIQYCGQIAQSNIEKNATPTILFEFTNTEFKTTSTDGHCLSHIQIKKNMPMIDSSFSFLISKKASIDCKKIIETLSHNEDIFIGRSNNKIIFSAEHFLISIKSINEKFPNFQKILQNNYKINIECNSTSFIKITKRLSLFTENKFIPATMTIKPSSNSINFNMQNNTIGKIDEEILAKIIYHEQTSQQEPLNISIFPPYILKAAQETQDQENKIHIKINERQKPILFILEKEDITQHFLVMPMIGV
jgi:DNA polymerase-3 subunit beta